MIVSVNKNIIPFFSIILTCYNRAYILEKAIKSILSQTCLDWECLIVDDGSNDNTTEIAKKYCDTDSRFRYLYHSNRKQAQSKNVGILAASGMFITFLDSDDEYATNHLEIRQRILFQYPDVEFLHGGVRVIGDEFVPNRDNTQELIKLSECIIGGTFVVRKEAAISIGGFDEFDYGDDTEFFDKAEKMGLVIAKIDFPTYIYNRNSIDSICNKMKKNL